MNITIKNQWYTKNTWMIRGIGAGLRPKSISPVNINNFSIVMKLRLADILRPTSMYCTMTHTITSFVFMNTIIHVSRRTRYMQHSTMVTWVMGWRVTGLGPVSTSSVTTNSFSYIARGKFSGLFRTISTYVVINSYILPKFSIIATSVFHPISIIKTDITLLVFMNIFIYTKRINYQSQKSTTVFCVIGGRLDFLRPIITSPFNINPCYMIDRVRVSGLLWPIFTSTNITTMITSAITRGIVYGINWPMYASLITTIHFKTFFFINFIVFTTVGGIMAGIMRPISYTFINTHRENTCSVYWFGSALLVWWMASVNGLRQDLSLNCVRFQSILI